MVASPATRCTLELSHNLWTYALAEYEERGLTRLKPPRATAALVDTRLITGKMRFLSPPATGPAAPGIRMFQNSP